MRKVDVFDEAGHKVIRFTPEAGSIKNGQFRLVPIHSHLTELGFLDFVATAGDGHLFAKGSYKRVVDFVRAIVVDPAVAPNHGWRHRFKSVARTLRLDAWVVDFIQGQAPRVSGDGYGDVSVEVMACTIALFPRVGGPLTGV